MSLVLSERSATFGSHRSLDYLPGAAFLGAVASQLYSKLTQEESFLIFHSGSVRFCNALPHSESGMGRPIPLSLHERKNEPVERRQPNSKQLFNFAHPEGQKRCRANGAQPRQLRSGWLTETGQVLQPARSYRMKTAVESTTGRAAEGQLFGYESLQPGLCFQGEVQFDNSVHEALQKKVLDAIKGTLRLGRSRSAQYGRVTCAIQTTAMPQQLTDLQGRLVLWLQADMACSRDGVPVFSPTLADLGLNCKGTLDVGASFIRCRSYAPYNGHRRLPDIERQVICAGSVLIYTLESVPSDQDRLTIAQGLGDWRESGLGQVLANPPLLAGIHPEFVQGQTENNQHAQSVAQPQHPLVGWLLFASGGTRSDSRMKEWVEHKLLEWAVRQESCRRFAGLESFELAGPTRTQWGAVQEKAKLVRDNKQQLISLLFASDAGLCRGGEDWERPFGSGWPNQTNLREWLLECINEPEVGSNVGLVIARLAGEIQKSLTTNSWMRRLPTKKQGEHDAT